MTIRIKTNELSIDDHEIEEVTKVLKSGMLADPSFLGGEKVREFEQQLRAATSSHDAIAVSSGTTAISAALMAAGIGAGDEVIVPPITFGATAATVLMQGAIPVFADINLKDFTIDPADVARKITPKTKMIIPVDLFGVPADYSTLREIIKGKNIIILEDSAQALGATYHGKAAGTLGDMGVISLYPGKVITAAEGGAVLTNNTSWAKAMRAIRSGGMTAPYHYEYLGSNFRLSELHAAIAVEQMKKLHDLITSRRRNATYFNTELRSYTFLQLPEFDENIHSNYYIYTILLKQHADKRDWIIEQLKERDIDGRAYYTLPLYKSPLYQRLGYGTLALPNTEQFSKSTFSLPVHSKLSKDDVEHIINSLKDIIEQLRA